MPSGSTPDDIETRKGGNPLGQRGLAASAISAADRIQYLPLYPMATATTNNLSDISARQAFFARDKNGRADFCRQAAMDRLFRTAQQAARPSGPKGTDHTSRMTDTIWEVSGMHTIDGGATGAFSAKKSGWGKTIFSKELSAHFEKINRCGPFGAGWDVLETLQFIWTHPLARRSRWQALSRYVRWQLGSRILGWPAVAPFVNNSKLVIEKSMHGATGNVYCGLYEFVDMAFLLHFLRPGDLFVDVGANVGTYTVLASAVVGAASLSIEPIPETFSRLQHNIRANDIDDLVTVACCAAGKCEETRQISVARGPRSRLVSEGYEGQTADVAVKPLDDLLNGQPTTLWKIDVEGSELEVLEGATRAIAEPTLSAVILEAHNGSIDRFMRSHGFEMAEYFPFAREFTTPGRGAASKNHLWLRDMGSATMRCRQGPSYEILSTTV